MTDVIAAAVKERRQDAARVREDAKRIPDHPIVRDHLLEMAAGLDDQAEMLERARGLGRIEPCPP